MAEEVKTTRELQIERIFEQPPDAVSFYCDMAQFFSTGNEIVMQFYEVIPGPPGPGGDITKVRTRLRATVTFSIPHARNIGNLLLQRGEGSTK
jgi:hypothetical protein